MGGARFAAGRALARGKLRGEGFEIVRRLVADDILEGAADFVVQVVFAFGGVYVRTIGLEKA